ncbi:MAG TPA: hypothetical protein VJ829_07460 [Candidatus Binatia bacterium]|nr:hypothetical protein [Candidatus Binatia bacterium]
MESRPESRRKAELLDALVRYLLRRGVSDLSLRPAAAMFGTTARMLIYYFGSRERLLFAAMEGRWRGQCGICPSPRTTK